MTIDNNMSFEGKRRVIAMAKSPLPLVTRKSRKRCTESRIGDICSFVIAIRKRFPEDPNDKWVENVQHRLLESVAISSDITPWTVPGTFRKV